MTKTPRKPSKSDTEDGESALRKASNMLETGLDGLKEYIERMSDIVRESSEPDIASDFAHTLHKVSLVTAELRKAETAERKAAEAMSKADILEAVRRLPPNEREQMGREIAALGAKRSGLA